jgi:imidazolonepropionase-like amidohydrolase
MTLSRRAFLAALGGLAALGPASAMGAPPDFYALTGTVIPGDGSPALEDHAVLVRGKKIEAVTPRLSLDSRIPVLHAGGFVLPGVINCHVHRIHGAAERRDRYLRHGVTAIGDAASPLSALARLAHGPTGRTATAACAGPMFCPPGGYPLPVHSPDHGCVVTSPLQAREKVRELADLGATMVKLAFEPGPYVEPWPLPDPATAAAVADQARRLGLVVRCHVQDLSGLEPALDAGVDVIDHVPHRRMTAQGPRPVLEPDESTPVPEYRRLLERMRRDRVTMVPTLDVLTRSLWNGPGLFAPVRAFHAMGGRIALGNDFPYRRTDAGMPLAEMRLLRKAGLGRKDVLAAATSGSAKACGFGTRGRIAPSMRADLLVVKDDPLAGLAALAEPVLVIKDGRVAASRA